MIIRFIVVIVTLLLLSACGRTVAFKDGVVSNQKQHDTDYNVCVQEATPLFPSKWIQQPYWVQVPVYGRRIRDGREERYISYYQSQMRFETLDANEGERVAYVTRCMSGKGYTYRYLSKEELEEQGLE
jgi:hypothetical protein